MTVPDPETGTMHDLELSSGDVLAIAVESLFSRRLAARLPVALADANRGRMSGLEALAAETVFARLSPVFGTNAIINCAEFAVADIVGALEAQIAAYPLYAEYLGRRIDVIRMACDVYGGLGGPLPVLDGDWPQVPTLVLSGGLDPVTPARAGEYLADHIKNAEFKAYPDQVHGVLGQSPCAWRDVVAFLRGGRSPARYSGTVEICRDARHDMGPTGE